MSSYQPSIRSSPDLSPEIAEALDRFARRRVWLVTLRSLAAALLTLLGTMSLVALCDYLWVLPDAMRWLLSTMAYAVTLAVGLYFCWPARRRRDLVRVARQLESAEPRWSEQLWSAVELADPNHANGSPAFRNWLQRRVARRLETLDVGRLLPIDLIRPWLIAAAILVVIATLLSVVPTIQFGRRMARAMLPGATIERASFIQIEIIEPLPPDRIVAAGDSVGIVAKITDPRGGLTGGDEQTAVSTVHLERRYADGQVQTSEMASRQLEENVYAAILPIGAQPLDYRILAGDGVTSWYRLTPAPRPQVEQFTKRYIYPSYAQLADRVVRDDRGELAALAGTTAEVTMRFDQPVTDAEIRLGAGSIGLSMKSVDQENREFSIKIPIESAQQYQVTAKSVQHSLTTGMGLLYPITPIPDTPPVARWLDKVSRQQLVPALAVIPLAATVADDLPVDQVRHQWRVNGGEIESDTLPVESAETNAIFSWQFDLTSASDQPFSSGDIVESRVVAVDRLGQQGQSPWIEILVAQHGIDPSRRQRLNQFADVVKTTLQWLQQATAWSNRLAELPSHVQQTAERLGQQREAISARLRQLLADTDQPNLVDQLEQIDRVLFETNQAIDQLAAETRLPATSSAVHSQLAELVGAAEDFLRTVASAQLIEAQVADALAARQLASELLAEPQDASPERLDRGRAILNTQFDLMDQQMTRWLDLLIDPAREQLALWHNWADNRTGDVKITPAWLSELDDQLDRWVNDGRLRTALKSSRDSVSKVLQPLSDTIRSLRKLGDAGETRRFAAHRDQLLDAVDAARSRHAAHVWNRPRHLADLGLLHRALKNVTRDGFVAFDHELPGEPLSNLAEACEVITGAYRLEQRHTQLQWLVEQERDPQLDAGTLVGHRNLFEAAIDGIDQTNAAINNSALVAQPDSFQLEARSLQRARQLISQRRVDGEMLTPAAPVIEKIAGDLKDHLQQLEPAVSEARAIIARYVQSVAEIAKAAAQAARRAKQAAEEADTSNLRREFPDAQVQTDELIEALIDFANAQSKTDTRGLEFAQDADVARAEITSAKRAAETAVAAAFDAGNPSAVQALERLAESLSLTAEHFSAVESGEDPSESRRALRDAAQPRREVAEHGRPRHGLEGDDAVEAGVPRAPDDALTSAAELLERLVGPVGADGPP